MSLPAVSPGARLGIPVQGIRKCVCIGRNYAEHAAESGAGLPSDPIVFTKVDRSLNGPFDPVIVPKNSTRLNREVELVVVIGKACSAVDAETAPFRVAGYMVANDYSEREFQEKREGQ